MTQIGDTQARGDNTGATDVHGAGGLADARSLGLAAFAATTFLFGLSYTTIWSPTSSAAMAISLALVYGGAIQILAGIWAFARRQTFPAVTLCSFGAFYISYYEFSRSIASGLSGPDLNTALEVFLLSWLIFSSYIFLAALRVNHVATVTYFFWWLTYLLLVIGLFLGNSDVIIGGGAAGVATAAAAWYGSCALLVNDVSGKEVLPLQLPRHS
jgi:hypothetical protein